MWSAPRKSEEELVGEVLKVFGGRAGEDGVAGATMEYESATMRLAHKDVAVFEHGGEHGKRGEVLRCL